MPRTGVNRGNAVAIPAHSGEGPCLHYDNTVHGEDPGVPRCWAGGASKEPRSPVSHYHRDWHKACYQDNGSATTVGLG